MHLAKPSLHGLNRQRALKLGLVCGAWAIAAAFAVFEVHQYVHPSNVIGYDSHAYWLAGHAAHPYGRGPGVQDAFLYTPVFAQIMHLIAWLPWRAFEVLWIGLEAAAFIWLLWPLALRWRVPAVLLVTSEVLVGNVHGFIALGVVLAVSHPETWTIPILTEVTPGGPAVVWHLVRREWSSLASLFLGLGVVVGASFLLDPRLWLEWWRFSTHRAAGGQPILLVVATLAGVAVAAMAAQLELPWLLPVAVMIALPRVVIDPTHSLTVLAAVPRLAMWTNRGGKVEPWALGRRLQDVFGRS